MPSSGLFNNSKTLYLQGPENVGGSRIIPNLCLISILCYGVTHYK